MGVNSIKAYFLHDLLNLKYDVRVSTGGAYYVTLVVKFIYEIEPVWAGSLPQFCYQATENSQSSNHTYHSYSIFPNRGITTAVIYRRVEGEFLYREDFPKKIITGKVNLCNKSRHRILQ